MFCASLASNVCEASRTGAHLMASQREYCSRSLRSYDLNALYTFFFFSRFRRPPAPDANRAWVAVTEGTRNRGNDAAFGRAADDRLSLARGARHWAVDAIGDAAFASQMFRECVLLRPSVDAEHELQKS